MIDLASVIAAFDRVLANRGDRVRVDADTPLSELAFDSLDYAEVLVVLEEQWRREIVLEPSAPHVTVRGFCEALALR